MHRIALVPQGLCPGLYPQLTQKCALPDRPDQACTLAVGHICQSGKINQMRYVGLSGLVQHRNRLMGPHRLQAVSIWSGFAIITNQHTATEPGHMPRQTGHDLV